MLVNISEIKNQIETKTFSFDKVHIFICNHSDTLPRHYIKELTKHIDLIFVDSEETIPEKNALFETEPTELYVYKCDEFKLKHLEGKVSNLLVLTQKLDSSDGDNIFVTDIPKMEEWMFRDYCKHLLPGVDDKDIDYLINLVGDRTDRLLIEVEKISQFDISRQQSEFDKLRESNDWEDLEKLNNWDFINFIQRKNKKGLVSIIPKLKRIDILKEGMVTKLTNSFKNIIDVQMDPRSTPESLNISAEQFKKITYSCNKFSNAQLIKIYEFLTSFDYKLKKGELQLSNEKMVDYIVCNLLTI